LFVAPADRVHLAGTATDLEAKRLISTLAAGLAGDDSGIRIDDGYIVYVVRSGDAPESTARRSCGSTRRLSTIRTFSREDTDARTKIGSELRIPN
jgi:hypothetical protein